ncbi:MAG TPA: hypothetical protein VE662_06815, partial [Solirubrobacterales bacterium]|nr:hypothetical protein [Solirubrobacterales bacterium]
QIWDAARKGIPDLETQIAAGELVPLRDWLRDRLYRYGGKFMPKELIERVVGGPIAVDPYLRQLEERVTELYGV